MSLSNDATSVSTFSKQLIQSGYIFLLQMQQALIKVRRSQQPLVERLEAMSSRPLPPGILQE